MNSVLLAAHWEGHTSLKIAAVLFLTAAFLYYNIRPGTGGDAPGRQRVLAGGRELMTAYLILFPCEVFLSLALGLTGTVRASAPVWAMHGILSAALVSVLALNGAIRAAATAKQLGTVHRVCLVLLWWMPPVNLALLGVTCRTVKRECRFEREKRRLDAARKGEAVCGTKYPILLLHGIFFRDWKYLNYWGRIPQALTDNGASVFYGNHNSSLPVEQTAQEIRRRILEIRQETGSEKVNIIAHSKGGIDARYAISCLGMDAHVASLTTINTPHRGSSLAGTLLDKSPEKLVAAVGKQYKKIFTKLGDSDCDFFGGVQELTAERCAALNETAADRAGVLYQSVGSAMNSAASRILPLSAGYAIIHPIEGENDGLVGAGSMAWGNFLGILRSAEKTGISHGDMIDMTKKNIRDFDVCEFYVKLVSGLKERGL
jgi:triacylglycerol lipase